MKIWHQPFTLEEINNRGKHTMVEHLAIEFTEIGNDFLVARMPVDHRTHQPLGIMNGGASCVLAESVGSAAGNYCVDPEKFYCVGLSINTNHLRPAQSGFVYARAKTVHLGRTTQVWNIEITDQKEKLISLTRLTLSVQKKGV